jgi:hypothetical protein
MIMSDQIHTPAPRADAARAEIERTRARMSETLDEIEENLLRTKENIRRRFDVIGRVRERPLESAPALHCPWPAG